MRFVAHGDGVERRLTFFPQGPDALRQLSEASSDGGSTWSIEYDLRYRRLAERQAGRRGGRVAGSRPPADGRAPALGSGGRAARPRRGPRQQPDPRADLGWRQARVVEEQLLVARRVVPRERQRLDRDAQRARRIASSVAVRRTSSIRTTRCVPAAAGRADTTVPSSRGSAASSAACRSAWWARSRDEMALEVALGEEQRQRPLLQRARPR